MVEFVFYSGEYPNLCRGVLVLKIDGHQYAFFPHSKHWGNPWGLEFKHNLEKVKSYYEDPNTTNVYGYSLVSGGCAGVDDNLEEYCEEGEWGVDFSQATLDDDYRFIISKDLHEAIECCINENVPFGCCGGCI